MTYHYYYYFLTVDLLFIPFIKNSMTIDLGMECTIGKMIKSPNSMALLIYTRFIMQKLGSVRFCVDLIADFLYLNVVGIKLGAPAGHDASQKLLPLVLL